ncbi:hypothetical protein RZS08_09290, partial [Arthrospira platensis SPKY1]|nr:hypothetical protein [Arthrospira platensis SPKY1]
MNEDGVGAVKKGRRAPVERQVERIARLRGGRVEVETGQRGAPVQVGPHGNRESGRRERARRRVDLDGGEKYGRTLGTAVCVQQRQLQPVTAVCQGAGGVAGVRRGYQEGTAVAHKLARQPGGGGAAGPARRPGRLGRQGAIRPQQLQAGGVVGGG